MYDFQKRTMFLQKWILNPQDLQQNRSLETVPACITQTPNNNNPHQHQQQNITKMHWPTLAGQTRWPKMDWPKLDWPKSATTNPKHLNT